MESNHPRSVTPRNSVLKTGGATGPHPSPHNESRHLARWRDGVHVRVISTDEVRLEFAFTGLC